MSDFPRFKYKRPQTSEERIEAIYEALSDSPQKESAGIYRPTLKDSIAELLERARKWEIERAVAAKRITNEQNWALGGLAFLALVFLTNGWGSSRDFEWLNENRFAIRLWGSAFAAVYIGVSIERTSFFRSLWSFGFTKLAASIAFSALLVFSTGKASSLINNVYGVDAAALPFTRAFMAGFVAFNYLSVVLIVVAILALLQAVNVIGAVQSWWNKEVYVKAPWGPIIFILIAIFFLFASFKWLNTDFTDDALPAKAYRLAHVLDFNAKHHCINLPQGAAVVFIGPEQDRVLVDANPITTRNIESFVNRQLSDDVPLSLSKQFYLLPCEAASVR